jgi:hypothetical protein
MKSRILILIVGVVAVVCVFGILAFMIVSPLVRNPAAPAAPADTATARSVPSTGAPESSATIAKSSATIAKAAASPTLSSTATKAAEATQPVATAKPTIAAAATQPPATIKPMIMPTPAPSPVPTQPPPDSLDYKTICTRDKAMTDAQWNEYIKQFGGRKVTWTGWVNDVYKSSEGYTLYVTFDPPSELFRSADVKFPITNELGLKLNKDQRVTFSGTLGNVTSFLGSCSTIEIKNAVVVP